LAWRKTSQYRLVACLAVGLACEAAFAPAAAAATASLGEGAGPSSPARSIPVAPLAPVEKTSTEAAAHPEESIPQLWSPRWATVLETSPPMDADSLFDGDATTGFTAQAGKAAAVRLELGSARSVIGLGVHGTGRATIMVYAEDNGVRKAVTAERGATLELTSDRWAQVALPPSTRTGTLVVQWSASASAAATLTELSLWVLGRSHEALSEAAVADRLVTELPENAVAAQATPWSAPVARVTQQGPVKAEFAVKVDRDSLLGRAFLVYEVDKKAHWTGVSRSVNGHIFRGGYRADARGLGGTQVEEINPAWLRRGQNTISFQSTAFEDAAGYSVRNVRLVSVPRGAEPAPAPAGGRAALSDGDLATGIGGPGVHTASVPSLAGLEPAFLSFYLDKPTGGTLTLSANNAGARRQGQVQVDLDGRPAGWQTVPIAGVLPATSDLRVRVRGGHDTIGQVSEARLQWFPALRSQAELALSYPLHGECNDHKTYVRGFISGPAHAPRPQYFVDGQPRLIEIDTDGSFESYVQEPEAVRGKPWSIRLDVATESGGHVTRTVPIETCIEPPKGRVLGVSPPLEDVGAPYGAVVSPHKASTLSFAGAKLEIPAGAVDRDVRVTMRALDRGQVSPLETGMDNVIASGGALRFGPHGLRFKKPVRVTLPVDASRMPEGMSSADVVAFFYDEAKSKWTDLPKVLGRPNYVVAESTHFTNFIAATLKMPDHPDAQQFNPNTMKNVKVGEPGAGITLIEPPQMNSDGSARLSYPIETPPARNGIGPTLALTYDSDRVNTNGWLGVGWDVRMSSIEIDTRFGVPRYDGTDVYLLDGAMLAANPPSGTTQTYTRRVEGPFDLINRTGTGPTNYVWTVTDKSGTVYTYGSAANSRLANPRNNAATPNIFRWYLDSVQDAYGNFMKVTYQHDNWSTTTTPSETFDEVYPSIIDYTANGPLTAPTLAANYHVTFTLDAVGTRPDNTITARPGFLESTRRRLDNIAITSGTTLVRQYKFIYYDKNPNQTLAQNLADTLQKSVLWAVALWGVKDDQTSELYRHTFEYNKAPATTAMFDSQSLYGQVFQNSPNGFVSRTGGGLSHSVDSLDGGSVMIGVGFPGLSATGSFGLDGGGSTPDLAFLAITGQGLPDQFDTSGTLDLNTMAGGKTYFNTGTLTGLTTLGGTGRSGWTAGGNISALGGVFGAGITYARHVQQDNGIITDMNGDGFPDVVTSNGSTFTAYLNDGKRNFAPRTWSGYDLSSSPFSTADRASQAQAQTAFFVTDPLIRWVAPFSGSINVNVTAARDGSAEDGARVDLYYATGSGTSESQTLLQSATLSVSDTTTHTLAAPVNNLKAGDRVYIRVASLGTSSLAPRVDLAPSITYMGGSAALDPTGFPIYSFAEGTDFRIAGLPRVPWHLTGDGDIEVVRCFVKSPTPDDVTVSFVIRNPSGGEVGRWNKLAPAASSGLLCFDDANNVLPPSPSDSNFSIISNVSADQSAGFEVTSDTPINPDGIQFALNSMSYTRYCRPDRSGNKICGAPQDLGSTFTIPGDPWPNFPIPSRFIAPNALITDLDTLPAYYQTYVLRTFNNGTTTTPQPMLSFPAPSASSVVGGTVTTTAALTEDVVVAVQGVNKLFAKLKIPKGTPGNSRFQVNPIRPLPPVAAGEALYFTIYSPTVIGGNVSWAPTVTDLANNTLHPVPAGSINQSILDPTFDNNGPVSSTTHDQMSGGFHRWFYGDWNDNIAFNDNAIRRTAVAPTNAGAVMAAAPRDSDNGKFWSARGGAQIRPGVVRTGRVSDPISTAGSAAGTAALRVGDTWNLDLQGNVPGVSAAGGGGDATTQVDFFDVNGDRFPDSVTRTGVAYNDGAGAFGARNLFDLGFGDLRSTTNASLQAGVSVGADGQSINETETDGTTRKLSTTVSLGGSVDYGVNSTRIDFVDVNGDGLPDHVAESPSDGKLRVKLNLGYGFSNEIAWSFPASWSQGTAGPVVGTSLQQLLKPTGVQDPVGSVLNLVPGSPNSTNVVRLQDTGTTALTEGVSLGVIGGGGGPTWSVTRRWTDLIDVNGDGLPDQVLKVPGDSILRVRLNKGDSFAAEQSWTLPAWTTSLGSDYTFLGTPDGVGFSTIDGWGTNLHFEFCFFVCFGMTGFTSDSKGGPSADFEDIDGDGKVDQVLKVPGDAGVYWKKNNIGQTNLLAAVDRPLGSRVAITYTRAGNHVDLTTSTLLVNMPSNQWVMASVVTDSDPGNSWNATTTENFDYTDPATGLPSGYYDPAERENYGFSEAKTIFPNEDVGGTSFAQAYYNQNYYERGLVRLSTWYQNDASAVPQRANRVIISDPSGKSLPTTPRIGTYVPLPIIAQTYFYEMQSTPKVQAESRSYDASGNLTDLVDVGDQDFRDPADDFNVHIDYQHPGNASQNITVPSAVTVRTGGTKNAGTLLAKRTALYTSLKPKPDSVTDVIANGKNPNGTARTEASPANATWGFTYDVYGNVQTAVSPAGLPPAGRKLQYTYDPQTFTYPASTTQLLDLNNTTLQYVSSSNYDLRFGRPTRFIDETGSRQEIDYDNYGRVTAVWAPTTFATNGTRNTTVPTIGVTYSEMPHTAGAAESLPAYAMATHNTNAPAEGAVPGGALTTRAIRTVNFVDGLDRSIQTKKDITWEDGTTNPLSAMSVSGAVAFDARGRIYQQGQPTVDLAASLPTRFDQITISYPTQFAYDVLGRLRQEQHPDNGVQAITNISYQTGLSPLDNKMYRLKITTDPLYASNTSYHYRNEYLTVRDELKLLMEPTTVNNVVTPLYTLYQYDPLSRVTQVSDANGNVTTAQYDTVGNLVQVNSPDSGIREWRYCVSGFLCAEQSPNAAAVGANTVIQYAYSRDRLDTITYPSGTTSNPSVAYTYGAANLTGATNGYKAGRVTHRVDEAGTFDYTYDPLGNVASEVAAYNSQIAGKTYQSYTTQYSWDNFGRLIDVTIPGTGAPLNTQAETIRYGYNGGGAVTSAYGKVGTAAATPYVTHVGYNEFDERVRIGYGNGAFSQYGHAIDTRRLTSAKTTIQDIAGQPARLAQSLVYAYDLVGNVLSRTQALGYDSSSNPVPVAGTMRSLYTYDPLNQLATALETTFPKNTDEYMAQDWYAYDQIGNITSKSEQNTHNTFDPNTGGITASMSVGNPYTFTPSYSGQTFNTSSRHAPSTINEQYESPPVSQTRTMQYDHDGNVAAILYNGVGQSLSWTDTDRLRSICTFGTPPQPCTFQARYNADGVRTHNMVTQGGTSTETLYVNQFLTVRNNGSLPTKHVYIGDERVASKVDLSATQSATYWYHSDNIQSTEYVTSSGQSAVQHLEYFPSGEIFREDNSIPASYGISHAVTFSAKELDASGFYYFGARYYDPRVQMWLSPDPILGKYLRGEVNQGVFNPQNLGLYSYAWNNPVILRDPTGSATWGDFWGGVKSFWTWLNTPIPGPVGPYNTPMPTPLEMIGELAQGYVQGPCAIPGSLMCGPMPGPSPRAPRVEEPPLTNMAGETPGGPSSGQGSGAGGARPVEEAPGPTPSGGTLTPAESAEIQATANKYGTTIDVVGSRAEGKGRNIDTDLPVGHGVGTRSDIDFRVDASHPQVGPLIKDLKKVGNGAGSASPRFSTTHRPTRPPFIRFKPQSGPKAPGK
jgi:RHS repeat-associated protein